MTIDPVQADFSVAVAQLTHQAAQQDIERRFANLLRSTDYATDRQDADVATVARDAAEQFVAIAFVQPLFAEMRSDPFKSDMFHGGMVEDMFGSQLDAILAHRITATGNFSVTEVIYQQLMKHHTTPKNNDPNATRNNLDMQA